MKEKYRIDGMIYSDGRRVCVVLGRDGSQVYRTKEYLEPRRGYLPFELALANARKWVKTHNSDKAEREP